MGTEPTGVRPVVQVVQGRETADGAGVRLRRVIGTAELDHLDPFLLLDEFKSDRPDDYLGGFPDHPHRGFETCWRAPCATGITRATRGTWARGASSG